MHRLILASASPRRRELVEQIGLSPLIFPANIDETLVENESPEDYVLRMAREKSESVVARLAELTGDKDLIEGDLCFVLGSDTSVVIGNEVLGKPKDKDDFKRMMSCLSDREHRVLTSVAVHAVTYASDGYESVEQCSRVVETLVRFKPLTLDEIESYWASGEPADKAGGYGIQGLGARFVRNVNGCYFSVVGLPLNALCELLTTMNFQFLEQTSNS